MDSPTQPPNAAKSMSVPLLMSTAQSECSTKPARWIVWDEAKTRGFAKGKKGSSRDERCRALPA